jgi:hypothetical protein
MAQELLLVLAKDAVEFAAMPMLGLSGVTDVPPKPNIPISPGTDELSVYIGAIWVGRTAEKTRTKREKWSVIICAPEGRRVHVVSSSLVGVLLNAIGLHFRSRYPKWIFQQTMQAVARSLHRKIVLFTALHRLRPRPAQH